MMEKKRFLDFLDRLDGGGAGQMGDKFEGGGLLLEFTYRGCGLVLFYVTGNRLLATLVGRCS